MRHCACTAREVTKNSTVYPAPDRGISIPRLTEGGYFLSHSELRNQCPHLKIQRAFDRPGKLIEGNLTLLTSGSPITTRTGQVKVKMFDDLVYLVLSCTTAAIQAEISQYNNMGRMWDTSKYHRKLSVTIFMVIGQDYTMQQSFCY